MSDDAASRPSRARTLADVAPGDTITVRIEVPRWSHRKISPTGEVDFVSPLPCPVNYGSVLDSIADDGDPLDAVLLGPRLEYGALVDVQVRGLLRFIDAGAYDPKLVCAAQPLTVAQRRALAAYFVFYAAVKRVLHRARGTRGRTAYEGWEW